MTSYHDRDDWTSEDQSGEDMDPDDVTAVAIHHPGDNRKLTRRSKWRIKRLLRSWWRYHVRTRGWRDIGYQVAVDGAGRVWELRGLEHVGAHCASAANPSANRRTVGVLFILGNGEQPTQRMLDAFGDLYRDRILPRYPKARSVVGHRQVRGAQTACPGDEVIDHIEAGTIDGDGSGAPNPPRPEWDGKRFPGESAFEIGQSHPAVKLLDKRLVAHGYDRHHDGDGYQPGPTYTKWTRANVRDFQQAQGWTGSGADGYPGPETWARLMEPASSKPDRDPGPSDEGPVVDLSKLRKAARTDPPRLSSKAAYPSGTKVIERALVAEGLLSRRYRDGVGHFGSKTVKAYGKWQRKCGYRGADADGVPGAESLRRLGDRRGFRVTG